MPDWKKIKSDYVRGGVSYRKLAEKYEVSPTTLYRRMKKEKWADLRKQKEEKANAKIIETVASQEAKHVDNIQCLADKLLKMIEERIADGTLIVDAKDLRSVTASIRDLREIKGCKSELDMQEQIARIEKLRRDAQSEEESRDIRVVIASELEDYAK